MSVLDRIDTFANWLDDPLGMASDKLVPSGVLEIEVTQGGDFSMLGGLAYYEPPMPELAEIDPEAAAGKFGLTRKGRIAAMIAGGAVLAFVVTR
ncbi:TPA_inf: hypothetical protein gp_03 [Marinomonas phage YY]|nr:TPA_inf: hypothetical protein gp_03 [Marinomonas phage YY]